MPLAVGLGISSVLRANTTSGLLSAPVISVQSGGGQTGTVLVATPGVWATGSPSGQWYAGPLPIAGQTNLTLTIPALLVGSIFTYREALGGEIAVSNPFQFWTPKQLPGYSYFTTGDRADVTSGTVSSLAPDSSKPGLAVTGGASVASGVLTFDGVNDTALMPAITTATATLSPIATAELPAASGSGANGGFTCTGIAKLPNGTWAIGNDGRSIEGDGSTNAGASIVIVSSNFTTKVAEILVSSLGITPVGSIQGVVYIPVTGQIAFVHQGDSKIHLLNATTFAYEGEAAGGAITNVNGLAYDPDPQVDAFVVYCSGVPNAVWRKRTTGAVMKTVAIGPDSNIDHLFYSQARNSIFHTQGANGTTGRIRERRASRQTDADYVDYTLTGADAIEGAFIDGNHLYIVNDAGYHSGSPAKNRILTYDISAIPSVPVWPVGSTVEFFGVIRIPSAVGSNARFIAGIGDALTVGNGGVGLIVPALVNNQLRITASTYNATWTVGALTTASLVYASLDLVSDAAELWINGVSQGVQSLASAASPDLVDAAPFYVASDRGTGRYFPGEITSIGAAVNSRAQRQLVEGSLAWAAGNTGLLPSGHPYKSISPLVP